MNKTLFVSIIIPVYNAGQYFDQCLTAITQSSHSSYEIIVVDDGSTDNSAEIAHKKGAAVFKLPCQSGPAAARNYAAQKAKGDILFFVDADVVIQQGAIARVVTDFLENPDIAAVFGSYDDSPAKDNFLSQYKNLLHHYVHQQSRKEAVTFWAGCGAIRREVFHKMGGFDQNQYPKPAIEDIELGYRMKKRGYNILLDKDLQGKHLKQWRLGSLLRADIFYRAVPWSKLMLESQEMVSDLNLQLSHKISSGLVGLLVVILALSFFEPRLLYSIILILAAIIVLNKKLCTFFLNRKGLSFAILAFFMHLLYYFYSGVTFGLCWSRHIFLGGKVRRESQSGGSEKVASHDKK